MRSPDPRSAARAAAGLLGGVAAYQVALAAGAPWGERAAAVGENASAWPRS